MQDSLGRVIDYIRVSITDRCNLRCLYCMPENGIDLCRHDEVLRYEEFIRLCRIFAGLGIKKIKITGGEALVRKDALHLMEAIKAIEGIDQVTLTTNGILLEEYVDGLVRIGIDGINISLDSLDSSEYRKITRVGDVEKVKAGLKKALQYPQLKLKINCVPFDGDKQNILDLAALAENNPVHVRFIEIMPIGEGKQFSCLREDSIKALIEEKYGAMRFCYEKLGNGPSHYYSLQGFQGKIGFISAISHKFCHECNRVRLTCTGYLKTCLQYDTGVDLSALIRAGASDAMLEKAIRKAVLAKPMEHSFLQKNISCEEQAKMAAIGG